MLKIEGETKQDLLDLALLLAALQRLDITALRAEFRSLFAGEIADGMAIDAIKDSQRLMDSLRGAHMDLARRLRPQTPDLRASRPEPQPPTRRRRRGSHWP